jgi:hypothetical protein
LVEQIATCLGLSEEMIARCNQEPDRVFSAILIGWRVLERQCTQGNDAIRAIRPVSKGDGRALAETVYFSLDRNEAIRHALVSMDPKIQIKPEFDGWLSDGLDVSIVSALIALCHDEVVPDS